MLVFAVLKTITGARTTAIKQARCFVMEEVCYCGGVVEGGAVVCVLQIDQFLCSDNLNSDGELSRWMVFLQAFVVIAVSAGNLGWRALWWEWCGVVGERNEELAKDTWECLCFDGEGDMYKKFGGHLDGSVDATKQRPVCVCKVEFGGLSIGVGCTWQDCATAMGRVFAQST